MAIKKSLYLLLVLTLFVTCAFAGCAQAPESQEEQPVEQSGEKAPEEEQPTDEVPSEKPVITFYHGFFQDDWQPAIEMRKLYEEFAALHADEFTFEAIPLETGAQGVYDKCVQEISRRQFPDIVDVAGYNIVPAAAEAGLIVDLKPYIDDDPNFKAGVGINYDQNMTEDGKIYTVREQLETIGFWYNEDLFTQAGAKTPDQWESWADFAEAVDTLNASEAVDTPFSLNQGWPTSLLLSAYMLGTEDARTYAEQPLATFDNPAFRDALGFIGENLQKIDSEYFTAGDSEKYREDFFSGKSALLFNGVWESSSFVEDTVTFDVGHIKPAVYPTGEAGKKAALVSASPGYIISSTQDQVKIDACIEFVKFMTSKETAEKIFSNVLAMPASIEVDYDVYINDTSLDPSIRLLAEACKLAAQADYQAKTIGANWDQDVGGAIEGKYAGLKDGSKSVDDVVSELNTILE